ncbi:hypothetical protein PPERSA_12648 [Pseudocohnilembus persalinus]|uniref:Uncharacterized protein n=1 Tax=Pseudocohnilembus persalinus TaxID=266149 RepID=A0A0V0QLY1_PSEPJ|nr:hypothetical protein PPERSA_12648 [Pseudocohnilembus persalinus]|eukprot:KRX03369.1 hypothetical protein PPERSA_12648 [Pseudocohnilembus persalinus]
MEENLNRSQKFSHFSHTKQNINDNQNLQNKNKLLNQNKYLHFFYKQQEDLKNFSDLPPLSKINQEKQNNLEVLPPEIEEQKQKIVKNYDFSSLQLNKELQASKINKSGNKEQNNQSQQQQQQQSETLDFDEIFFPTQNPTESFQSLQNQLKNSIKIINFSINDIEQIQEDHPLPENSQKPKINQNNQNSLTTQKIQQLQQESENFSAENVDPELIQSVLEEDIIELQNSQTLNQKNKNSHFYIEDPILQTFKPNISRDLSHHSRQIIASKNNRLVYLKSLKLQELYKNDIPEINHKIASSLFQIIQLIIQDQEEFEDKNLFLASLQNENQNLEFLNFKDPEICFKINKDLQFLVQNTHLFKKNKVQGYKKISLLQTFFVEFLEYKQSEQLTNKQPSQF